MFISLELITLAALFFSLVDLFLLILPLFKGMMLSLFTHLDISLYVCMSFLPQNTEKILKNNTDSYCM